MFTFHRFRRLLVLIACVFGLTHSIVSIADMVSFAAGGYARGGYNRQ
jgi:hypothetical protein